MKIIFEMDVKEIWRKIKNWPYKISNYGRVKRSGRGTGTYVGKILKPGVDTNGYLFVNLCKDGKTRNVRIHKLVAETFIGPSPKGHEVNHINGHKPNNEVWNLEYVTASENMKHAYKIGLRKCGGENVGSSKLTNEQVKKIRKLYKITKYSQKRIAQIFNIDPSNVSNIVNDKTWKHVI